MFIHLVTRHGLRQGSAECLLELGLPICFAKIMAKLKTVEVLVKASFKTEQMSNRLVKFDNELFYKLLTIQTKVSCIYLVTS